METLEIKQQLYSICKASIEKRIKTIEDTLKSIEESRNNETKSSVGDKYETGRAMMQIEEGKSKAQLLQAAQVRNELTQIDVQKTSSVVEVGSLIETNKGNYYLSIGIGKVRLEGNLYYCLSVNSPIGKKLIHKKAGDAFDFNGTKILITAVY